MIPVTMAAYETRRGLWLLPLGFLIWANCHGGFIMGWAVAACYCAEALYHRLKGTPAPDLGKICGISILAVLASFFNPNGFGVLTVMLHYQTSPLQTHILEWNYPAWWPPGAHNLLMIVTALVMLLGGAQSASGRLAAVRVAGGRLFDGAAKRNLHRVRWPCAAGDLFPPLEACGSPHLGIRRRSLATTGPWRKNCQRKGFSVANGRLEVSG